MHALGTFLIHLITALFFIGLAGSAIVIVLSFVEDFRELFGREESDSAPAGPVNASPSRKNTA